MAEKLRILQLRFWRGVVIVFWREIGAVDGERSMLLQRRVPLK
jgi:hypothetical protein